MPNRVQPPASTAAPFGSWRSPITPSMITSSGISIPQIATDDESLYWLENRPLEHGRGVVVRRRQGTVEELTPAAINVRTRVHEYGGGAFWVHQGALFFANFSDQRLYRRSAAGDCEPITPEPAVPAADRYADGCVTPDGHWTICIREAHVDPGEARNEVVILPANGASLPRPLVGGNDFYACPRLHPDGTRLAWIEWSHPRMPWDGTELWVADFDPERGLTHATRVAGGPDESIFQPRWSPRGDLHFVSDCTGWWNLYAVRDGDVSALCPREAEFGGPQWVFGLSRYAFLADGTVVCSFTQNGQDHLGALRPGSSTLTPLDTPFTSHIGGGSVQSDPAGRVYFLGGSAKCGTAVIGLDPESGHVEVIKRCSSMEIDPGYLSTPEPIRFPTRDGSTAHAFYYPPTNKDFSAPADERPPLLVLSHGGPTSATTSELRLGLQFWTSRGFAVVDVNYAGSTGFGRAYRERLNGQWGIVDTSDCIEAATYLERRGDIDGTRIAIRGGSAGGFTTLCALVFHDRFSAGASYYGVADLEALAHDTHKFESHYLDSLIGPYPETRERYRARSPIHFTDQLSCPVIMFQGLEDRVVPPSQAEAMVDALQAKGLPYAYIPLKAEQHGFRIAKNIERCLEAEFYFYSRIFGFDPSDPLEPIPIENL